MPAGLAPQVMAWQGRSRNLPGPITMGASLPGVPLLPTFISGYNFAALLGFGVDATADPSTYTLTDVSLDVQQTPGISIVRGRFDEQSTTMPATCSFALDNRTGNYSTRRPQSIYYPNVRVGMPLKIVVATAGDTFERFSGFVDSWEPGWDTSGNYAIVNVTAHGALYRMGQGNNPLHSPLFRAIPTLNPLAYWPMEDGADATYCASAVGGPPMVVQSGTATFGADGGPGGAASVDFSGSLLMRGAVPAAASSTSWRVSFMMNWGTGTITPGTTQAPLSIATANGDTWYVSVQATSTVYSITFGLVQGGAGGSFFGTFGSSAWTPTTGRDWHLVDMIASQNGANIDVSVTLGSHLWGTLSGFYTGVTLSKVTAIKPGDFYIAPTIQTFMLNHIAVTAPASTGMSTTAPDLTNAVKGYSGETAITRLTRLCAEERVPLTVYGTDGGKTMGVQATSALLTLLREAEDVGGGVLEDGVNFGLAYRELGTRYNQTAALAPTLNQLAPPLAPVEGTQRTRNDVTVSRTTGSTGHYAQPAGQPYAVTGAGGIGSFTDYRTLNVDTDDVLSPRAAWYVHLGTVDADRYPNLALNLAARTALIPAWLGCANGSRITVASTYPNGGQAPDVLLEGWTEDLSTFMWDVAANCAPALPWAAAIFDAVLYDSATSTLALLAPAGTTSLSVAVGDGLLWKTGAVSFDINVGGARFPVTNIAGASSPQTFTIGAVSNGVVKDIPAGASVRLWNPPTYAL